LSFEFMQKWLQWITLTSYSGNIFMMWNPVPEDPFYVDRSSYYLIKNVLGVCFQINSDWFGCIILGQQRKLFYFSPTNIDLVSASSPIPEIQKLVDNLANIHQRILMNQWTIERVLVKKSILHPSVDICRIMYNLSLGLSVDFLSPHFVSKLVYELLLNSD